MNINYTGCRPPGGWPFLPCPGPFYPAAPAGPCDLFVAGPGPGYWSAPPSFYPPCLPGPTDWGTPIGVPPGAYDPWSLGYPQQQWSIPMPYPAWVPGVPTGPPQPPAWSSTSYLNTPSYATPSVAAPASVPSWTPAPAQPASPAPAPAQPVSPTPAPSSGQIRGLERIKELAGSGSWAAQRVASALSGSENSSPADQAGAAADALSSATSDNGETDSSEAGRQAVSSLNDVERMLNQLGSGSSDLGSVASTVQSIRSEINGLDRSTLKNSSRLDSIEQSLGSILSSLNPANSAVSKLDSAADDARYSLRNARDYATQVSGDSAGTDVSFQANRARAYAQSLQSQLKELSDQAKYGGSDVSSLRAEMDQIAAQASQLLSEQA